MREHMYPKETAGRLMARNVPLADEESSCGEIKKILSARSADFETVNYIYLTDARKRLRGAISIKELLRTEEAVRISERMTRDMVTVRPHTDQERVAHLALEHNIKAVPVVDKDGVFQGVVTSDAILRILHEEAGEDIARIAGVYTDGATPGILKTPISASVLRRLPWLLIGLAGGVLLAKIIGAFDRVLAEEITLVAFLPLLVYMAGATSTQVSVFVVRDLAMARNINIARYIVRHFWAVFLIALFSSVIFYTAGFLLLDDGRVIFTLAVALFATMLSAVASGLFIPLLLSYVKLDPANGSGPFGMITQDIISTTLYLAIAAHVMA